MTAPLVPPAPRFDAALRYAVRLHGEQRRKIGGAPYLSHLLGVSALVLAHGGNEDALIAALLHDAAEDQGGQQALDEIALQFGTDVARLVEACSDTLVSPKPPWRPRKEAFLNRLPSLPAAARRIIAADKLDNVRSILSAHYTFDPFPWERFKGGRTGTLWYHREVAARLVALSPDALERELVDTVERLEHRAQA